MKLKVLLMLFLVFCKFCLYSQRQADKWYFEQYNGLDFSGDTVKFLSGCQFGANESSSSICDSSGNLIFYSNGITLYNKFNKVVKNGVNLGFPMYPNETSSRQGTLLIKHPDNDSLIYLFCTDYQARAGGLVYSVINMRGNNDSGEVIQKKIKLLSSVNEPINAVNHNNGRDIWIVCHSFGGVTFYLFILNKNGVMKCPITSEIGAFHYELNGVSAQTNIKFSPNGKMITQYENIWGNTETFLFNAETGKIHDTVYLNPLIRVAGFDFSNDSKYLYVSQIDSGIGQIDLLIKKKTRISNFDQSSLPLQIQLAPDGKIYGAIYNKRDLFVIDKPNLKGNACNVIIKKNFLQYNNITAMPNFNQSYFYTSAINFKYEMECIGNSVKFWGYDTFGANVHNWRITRNKAIVATYSAKDISHSFTDTGKYEVRYIADNGTRKDTVIKTITIYPKINKQFLGKDTVYPSGTPFNKTLKAPYGMHCQLWQDSTGLSTYMADTAGVYICKVTNKAFCEVTDTIVIKECINLTVPSIYRSRDTLYTYQQLADSFVWFRNNVQYKITKEAFIKLTDTGTYRVEAAKKDHCNRSSTTAYVNKLGIRSISINDIGIKLYPNPSSNKVFIESENSYKLQINDVTGRVISHTDFNSTSVGNMQEISLQKGVYFFIFIVGDTRITEKVIVL